MIFLSLPFHKRKRADLVYRPHTGRRCVAENVPLCGLGSLLRTTYSLAEVAFHSVQAFMNHILIDT